MNILYGGAMVLPLKAETDSLRQLFDSLRADPVVCHHFDLRHSSRWRVRSRAVCFGYTSSY
jgi:hypothetical protein